MIVEFLADFLWFCGPRFILFSNQGLVSQKWLPYQIIGGKTLKKVQIDEDIVDKAKLDVVSKIVSECVSDIYLIIEKLMIIIKTRTYTYICTMAYN